MKKNPKTNSGKLMLNKNSFPTRMWPQKHRFILNNPNELEENCAIIHAERNNGVPVDLNIPYDYFKFLWNEYTGTLTLIPTEKSPQTSENFVWSDEALESSAILKELKSVT